MLNPFSFELKAGKYMYLLFHIFEFEGFLLVELPVAKNFVE